MTPGREDLVRVRSLSELRPGMLVVSRVCLGCNRECAKFLVQRLELALLWRVAGGCGVGLTDSGHLVSDRVVGRDFALSISHGRLFRLRELDDQQSTTSERQREREDA